MAETVEAAAAAASDGAGASGRNAMTKTSGIVIGESSSGERGGRSAGEAGRQGKRPMDDIPAHVMGMVASM
eukprot:1888226-Prymnesium_polylepis.1